MDALAHEFKTPLTATKAAWSDLAASDLPGSRERELAAIVEDGLERLQQLVSDAVQMLRIDAGTFAVHRHRKALADIVRETLNSVEPRLDGRQVLNQVPEPLFVDADPELLGLALRQLLDNAVKYSPATSTIELRAASNGTVDLAVRNSGPPIPVHEQAHISSGFIAAHRPGMSQDLASASPLCDRLRKLMVELSASPAMTTNGTEFRVSLPRGDRT